MPPSFGDVNVLRTDLQHDTDHGSAADFRRKKKKAGGVFEKYSGVKSPEALAPDKFVLVQAKLLTALLGDLRHLHWLPSEW